MQLFDRGPFLSVAFALLRLSSASLKRERGAEKAREKPRGSDATYLTRCFMLFLHVCSQY